MRKTEDLGLIPGLGRFPGEGNGTPLQYSCLKESDTTERLHFLFFLSLSSTDSLWIIAIFLSILCSFIFFIFLVVALYFSNILYTFTPSPPNKHTPLTVPGLLCIFLTMKIFTTRLLLTQISAQFQLKYHVLKNTIFDHPIYISREASTTLSCFIFSMSEWSRSVVSDFFATPWTVANQAPPSMEFSRQEYWSGWIFFSRGSSRPRDLTQVSHIVGRCFTVWAPREVSPIFSIGLTNS